MQMISKFQYDLFLTMLYLSVNFEWKWSIPSKVIYHKPKLRIKLKPKKGPYSVKIWGWSSNSNLTSTIISAFPSLNFKWNWCISSKVIDQKPRWDKKQKWGKKTKSKRAIADDLQIRIWPVFNNALPFCKFWMELMHPFKSYWSVTKFEAKPKSKKDHNSVKILSMISQFKLDLYLIMIYTSVNFEWN